MRGIYRWRVKFPHKGSVKRQAFPCHFVIMKTWSYMGLFTVFQSAIKCLTCVSFGMVSYYTKYSLCDIIEVWQRQTWSARLVALRLLVDNLSHIQYALFFTQTLKNPLKWHINRIWPDKRYFLSSLDLPAVLQCRCTAYACWQWQSQNIEHWFHKRQPCLALLGEILGVYCE